MQVTAILVYGIWYGDTVLLAKENSLFSSSNSLNLRCPENPPPLVPVEVPF